MIEHLICRCQDIGYRFGTVYSYCYLIPCEN